MKQIAAFINEGIKIAQKLNLLDIGSADKKKDQGARKEFKLRLQRSAEVEKLKKEVINFAKQFPVV